MLHTKLSDPQPSAGSSTSEIVMLDGIALANAICSRKVSCVMVMTAYLDHIERINPPVNAIFALQDRAGLLVEARECDAQLLRGKSIGPLHGFPLAVKDLVPVCLADALRLSSRDEFAARSDFLDPRFFRVIESWRRHYDTIRPHASLGYKPPAPEVFLPVFAAWPAALPRPAPPATLAQRPTLN